MRKKIIINLTLFVSFILFNWVFSADQTKSRENYQSCINLSNSLQTFLKENKDLSQDSEFSTSFFASGISRSNSYLSLYQDHNILILKNNAPNLTATKLIARIKVPQNRNHIQHHILENDLLLLSAENQSWYQVLWYQIQNDKIKNIKSLTFSAPIQTITTMNQKLLILSQTWLTRNQLSKLAKHQKTEELHTLLVANNFLSTSGTNITPSCKEIQHQLLTGHSPNLNTITIFDLDALEKAPEISYYLGNISQIFFWQDYLFFAKNLNNLSFECQNCISHASGGQTTLLQRFTLEPRLHPTENALLSGHLLSFSPNTINSPNLLLAQNSGNIKQFSISNFDSKFSKLANNQVLIRTQQDFSQVITGENSLILANKDQTKLLPLPAKTSTPNISKDPKSDFLYQSSLGISLLHTEKNDNWISLTLTPLTFSGTSYEMQIPHSPSSQLLRNSEKHLLSFFTETNSKPSLHTYHISDQGKAQHLFSRNYSKLSKTPHFQTLSTANDLVIVAFREYLDLFSLSSPQKTKLLKLK